MATIGLALFVIAPAIGNEEIKGTTLQFTQINISNPRDKLFDMSAHVTLGNLKPLGGTIEGELLAWMCRSRALFPHASQLAVGRSCFYTPGWCAQRCL
jgi:hypothetical protein